MVCGNDVSKGKPDPEIYFRSMDRLGLRPDQCLAIEDGFLGVQAARVAGARVFKVENISEVKLDRILPILEGRSPFVETGGSKMGKIRQALIHTYRRECAPDAPLSADACYLPVRRGFRSQADLN